MSYNPAYKIVHEQSLAPYKMVFNVYEWDGYNGYHFRNGFDTLQEAEASIKPKPQPARPTKYYDADGNEIV